MPAFRRPLLASTLALLLGASGSSTATAATEPTFRSSPGPAVGNVLAAQVALVDGDDVPDLVTGVVGEGFLVELGRGDGTFRAPQRYAVPNAAYSVSVADVTGDGTTDVVALSNGATPYVVTFEGTGDGLGTLERQSTTSTVAPSGYATALGDFNGDGALDLAVPVGGLVHFYPGTRDADLRPTGRFSPGRSVTAPSATNVFAPLVSDLNRDGELDLVLPANGGKVGVLLSDTATTGAFTFAEQVVTTAVSSFDVAVGDLDGVAGDEVAYASGSRVGYLRWTSGRTFTDSAVSTSLTSAAGVSVADYDGDGLGDVGVATGTTQRWFLGTPPVAPSTTRTFRASTTTATVDKASHAQHAADLDVDGFPDTVLTSPSSRRSVVLVNTSGDAARRAPSLVRHPDATTALDGSRFSLTAASTGTPSTVVRWERALRGSSSWTELVEGEVEDVRSGTSLTSTWTGPAELVADGARYRAVFTGDADGARSSSTDPVVVTVVERAAPAFTTAPRDQVLREGSDAVFTVAASGAPAPSVSWAVAGPGSSTFTALPTTGPTLTVPSLGLAQDGSTYRATLTNSEGTVSSTAGLRVDPLPVLVTPPADLAVRPGEPARFAVASESADVVWQTSTDAGRTWSTLATTGPALELSTTTAAQNGHRFRARLDPWGTSPGTPLLTRAALLAVDAAPGAPTSLTATEAAPGTVTVRWLPPAATTDISGWALEVDGAGTTHSAAAREAVVKGLVPGVHLVELRARDAVGPGAPATVRVTTVGAAPASPSASASPSAAPSTSATTTPSATSAPSRSGTPTPSAPATPSASGSAGATPSASASPTRAAPTPARSAAPSPTEEEPTPEAAPSALTLQVAAPLVTTGGLSRLSGTAAPGATVELLGYVRPSTDYRVLRTTQADDEGRFSFEVRPTGNMRAYARTSEEHASPSVVQLVRSAVSLRAASTSARGAAFSGVVWPKLPGQLVNLYVVTGERRSLLTQARTAEGGAYSKAHVFAAAGRRYTVVAVVPRTIGVEPGESVRRAVVTRR